MNWLESNKNQYGKWDMGSSVNDKVYFPLSDNWRKKETREADCLAQFSMDDLFPQQIEEIYMDARDATVKIICNMGRKIIGKPIVFYEGTNIRKNGLNLNQIKIIINKDRICCAKRIAQHIF